MLRNSERIPVDPAGDCCYWDSTKPCKYSSNRCGRLSNTSVTCPMVRHNLAKVRVIPDREQALEWVLPETRAVGWAGGGLGCWRCNGPPNRRSVRAMRVVARRGTLRYWSQPYGVQQARNLYNARKCDKGIPSAHH